MTTEDCSGIGYVILRLDLCKSDVNVHSPTSSTWPAVNDPRPSPRNPALYAVPAKKTESMQDTTQTASRFRASILESAERLHVVDKVVKKKPLRSTKASTRSKKVKSTIEVHEDDDTLRAPLAAGSAFETPRGRPDSLTLMKSDMAAGMLSPSHASDLNVRPKPVAAGQKRKFQEALDLPSKSKRARKTPSSMTTGLDLTPGLKSCPSSKNTTATQATEGKDAAAMIPNTAEKAEPSPRHGHSAAAKGMLSNKRKITPDPFDEDDGLFDKFLTDEMGSSSHLPTSYQDTQAPTNNTMKTCAAVPRKMLFNQPALSSPPTLLPSVSSSPGPQQPPTSPRSSPIKPFLRDASSIMATTCITRIPHLQAQYQTFTCFRIAEALRLCPLVEAPDFVVNLYARIKRSYRVGQSDFLNICFADLFFPHKPPYLESTCRDPRTVRLGVDVVESLDEELGAVKAIVNFRKKAGGDQLPRQTHHVELLGIMKTTWDDVMQTKDLLEVVDVEDDEEM